MSDQFTDTRDPLVRAMNRVGDRFDTVRAEERKRCVKIVRDALDTGEYERSLGYAIVERILKP